MEEARKHSEGQRRGGGDAVGDLKENFLPSDIRAPVADKFSHSPFLP